MVNMKGDINMKLKQYIDENKVNQQWIAEQLGITYQALYVKLVGKGNFSIKQALTIKKLLRLTWEEFEELFG
jgi:DNA-binding XRE family transcriptional regulator